MLPDPSAERWADLLRDADLLRACALTLREAGREHSAITQEEIAARLEQEAATLRRQEEGP
jgi:hypothetical protein